jgi:hypothetical protein
MTTKTLILILFTLTFSFARGQNPQVKKEIKVVSTFDYNYSQDGKLYLSRKGNVKTDTIIKEYNRDGTLLKQYQNPYVTFGKRIILDSTVLISLENNINHQREYWSDTTFIDVYSQNFVDSIIQTKTSKGDTIQINKSFFHKGQLVKTNNRDFRNNYGKFNEVVTYDKKTKSREVAIKITTYYKDGLTDTIRVDNKKKLYKTLVLNSDKNEWYIKEKTKYQGRKMVVWRTFYHDYHKMYFTTKTTTEYNKVGQPIVETVYDTYLRHIEKKTTYNYEYY